MKRNLEEDDIKPKIEITIDETEPLKIENKKTKLEVSSTNQEICSMDCQDDQKTLNQINIGQLMDFLNQPSYKLVERNEDPLEYSLINSQYVGKQFGDVFHELEAKNVNASTRLRANGFHRLDQCGLQMKYDNDPSTMQRIVKNLKRDCALHMAACNFVKKPGNTYHLYERSSGQQYFSMLSPIDWRGIPPHKFLGSWHLDFDETWYPTGERDKQIEAPYSTTPPKVPNLQRTAIKQKQFNGISSYLNANLSLNS
ncbi:hypothetical protein ABEB36_010382 [Hypothenemus hampei]|uniref:Uncharacterized protein n=1 Tax=Hypothenemus hampei TaxID=57062 RepID=A0ABD1EJI9_HYPHA